MSYRFSVGPGRWPNHGYPQGKKTADETQDVEAKGQEIQKWRVHEEEVAPVFWEFHGKDPENFGYFSALRRRGTDGRGRRRRRLQRRLLPYLQGGHREEERHGSVRPRLGEGEAVVVLRRQDARRAGAEEPRKHLLHERRGPVPQQHRPAGRVPGTGAVQAGNQSQEAERGGEG